MAAWWSGTLLLIVGLHALDGYFLWRRIRELSDAGSYDRLLQDQEGGEAPADGGGSASR